MNESRIYGINACQSFYKHQKKNVIRAFFSKKAAPQFTEAMKFFAAQKKVYRIITDEEMEKVSKTMHHEGVCFVVSHEKIELAADWLQKNKALKKSVVLCLEKVANPHNLGAIMRICTHFDVKHVAHTEAKSLQSGAAFRTSEGGALFVKPLQVDDVPYFIKQAKLAGYQIVTTTSHEGRSVYDTNLSDKVVLFFGEEGPGLSESIFRHSDIKLQIPGSGHVESLNVSTAIAVILSEVYRKTL